MLIHTALTPLSSVLERVIIRGVRHHPSPDSITRSIPRGVGYGRDIAIHKDMDGSVWAVGRHVPISLATRRSRGKFLPVFSLTTYAAIVAALTLPILRLSLPEKILGAEPAGNKRRRIAEAQRQPDLFVAAPSKPVNRELFA